MEVKKIIWFDFVGENPESVIVSKGFIDGKVVCWIYSDTGGLYRVRVLGNEYLSEETILGVSFSEIPNAIHFFEKDFVSHIFGLYFESEPDYKRIIKQLYRLTLELVKEIAWNNAGLPHIKEYRKSKLDRFKKILGMEVK